MSDDALGLELTVLALRSRELARAAFNRELRDRLNQTADDLEAALANLLNTKQKLRD